MRMFASIVIWAILAGAALAQEKQAAKPKAAAPPAEDRLGMTCAQILQMTSTDWETQFRKEDTSPEKMLRALAAYGKCYDARTDRLAAQLAKSGKGPLMGARGNFRDFEKALTEFTTEALAATDPPADAVKTTYAALYEKQFRYEFYRSYEVKGAKPGATTGVKKGPVEKEAKSAGATSAAADQPPPAASAGQNATDAAAPGVSPTEISDMTKAKNHFGELMGLLPQEKMHAIHKSFGKIFSGGPVSEETKLAVYRYGIFLLESPTATPFSPPPF